MYDIEHTPDQKCADNTVNSLLPILSQFETQEEINNYVENLPQRQWWHFHENFAQTNKTKYQTHNIYSF